MTGGPEGWEQILVGAEIVKVLTDDPDGDPWDEVTLLLKVKLPEPRTLVVRGQTFENVTGLGIEVMSDQEGNGAGSLHVIDLDRLVEA